jgi:hypothetical protein
MRTIIRRLCRLEHKVASPDFGQPAGSMLSLKSSAAVEKPRGFRLLTSHWSPRMTNAVGGEGGPRFCNRAKPGAAPNRELSHGIANSTGNSYR